MLSLPRTGPFSLGHCRDSLLLAGTEEPADEQRRGPGIPPERSTGSCRRTSPGCVRNARAASAFTPARPSPPNGRPTHTPVMTVPGGAEPQQGWVLAGPPGAGESRACSPHAESCSHGQGDQKEKQRGPGRAPAGRLATRCGGGSRGCRPPITLPFLWEDGNQQAIGEVCARQDSFLEDPHLPSPPRPQGTRYPHPTSTPMLLWSPGDNSVIHFVNSDTD